MDCSGFVSKIKQNFHLRVSSDHLESLGQLTPTRKQDADLGITSAIPVTPRFCRRHCQFSRGTQTAFGPIL